MLDTGLTPFAPWPIIRDGGRVLAGHYRSLAFVLCSPGFWHHRQILDLKIVTSPQRRHRWSAVRSKCVRYVALGFVVMSLPSIPLL